MQKNSHHPGKGHPASPAGNATEFLVLEGFITSGLATYRGNQRKSEKAGEDFSHVGKVETTHLSLPPACLVGEGTQGACDSSSLDHWFGKEALRTLVD